MIEIKNLIRKLETENDKLNQITIINKLIQKLKEQAKKIGKTI